MLCVSGDYAEPGKEAMEDYSVALCLNISFTVLAAKQLFINHVRTSKYRITVQSVEASVRFQGEINILKLVLWSKISPA